MRLQIGLKILLAVFFLSSLGTQPARAAELECSLMPQIMSNYFQIHYTERQLNSTIRDRTIKQFIQRADPSKTLLIAEDVDTMRPKLMSLFATMPNGECAALREVNDLLVRRAKENEKFAKKLLDKAYKLDETVELNVDPEARGYATSPTEKELTLEKLIHFQMANLFISEVEPAEARKQLKHRYELASKRIRERSSEDLRVEFMESFASALDPHTSFLSQDKLQNFRIAMQLSLEGIGATLSSQDGFTVVEGVIAGGAADQQGKLRPKDKILAVKQKNEEPVSVIDMELSEVVKMIRGKKGTEVTLTILRQGDESETFDLTIVRDKIDVKEQAAKINYVEKELNGKTLTIAVLELPSFYGGGGKGTRSSYTDVKKLLLEAKKKEADAVVLDLSRNGGGLLENAVKISGLFIDEGAVVATKDSLGRKQVLRDDDGETVWAGPLVVLVSRMSASASEILAGTLKAYDRALVVGGEHTFGKGTVQSVMNLPHELGAMTVTMGMFFTANGKSTQHTGVVSHIDFPSLFEGADFGEKTLDYSLPTQSIDGFLSKSAISDEPGEIWLPISDEMVKQLYANSATRVAGNAGFAEMKKKVSENQSKVIKLSEILNKSKSEKAKADKAAKAAKAKKSDKGGESEATGENGNVSGQEAMKDLIAPMIDESVSIAADLAVLLRANVPTLGAATHAD